MSFSPATLRRLSRLLAGHRWVRSLSTNILTAIAAALAVMGATILMTRMLGPAQLGRVSFLVIVFNAVATLDGLRPVIVVKSSRDQPNDPVPSTALIIMAVIGSICAMLIAGAEMVFDFGYDLPTGLVIAIASGLYFPVSVLAGLLEAEGETIFTGTLRNGGWMVTYMGFAAATWLHGPLFAYAGILLLFQVFTGIACLTRLARSRPHAFSWTGLDPIVMRGLLHDAVNLVGFNLSALVLGTTDRVVLGWVRGFGPMGPYASIYEMATRPTAFMRVIAGVSLPELKMRRGSARVYRVWAASLFGFFSVTTLSVAILSFFRYEIVKFVFGSNLLYTGNAFALIAMTMPISIAGYFCITLLSAEGDFRSPRLHYARGAVFMVIAAYPLIHWRGLDGAAMLFLASRWIDLALLRQTLKRFAIPVSPRAVIVWSGVSIGLLATALSSRAWLFLPCFCVAATLVWVKQLQLIKGLDEKCHG